MAAFLLLMALAAGLLAAVPNPWQHGRGTASHPAPVQSVGDIGRPQLELKKLQAEIAKLESEKASYDHDFEKVAISAAAVVVPLLVIIITLYFQGRTAQRLAERQERTSFQLKVAELLLASDTPWTARATLELLHRLYPERITRAFIDNYDVELFPGTRLQSMQMQLFQELARASSRAQVVDSFLRVFPAEQGRDWFARVRPLLDEPPAPPPDQT